VRPLIFAFPEFASPAETHGLLDIIEDCHRYGREGCDEHVSRLAKASSNSSPRRNSTSFSLSLANELESPVDELLRRAHMVARIPIENGEGAQVASYAEGNFYEFHHDSLSRRATLLLYLNDVAEGDGGETIFPLVRSPHIPKDAVPPLPPAVHGEHGLFKFKVDHLEPIGAYCDSDFYLKIRPEAGKGILFFSYGPDHEFDPYAIHGACPLHHGQKAIFQRWMRFQPNSLYEEADESIRAGRIGWGLDGLLEVAPPKGQETKVGHGPHESHGRAQDAFLSSPSGSEFDTSIPEL